MSEEEQKRKEEIFSTTGTIRDQLPELEETNVVFVIVRGKLILQPAVRSFFSAW